jgi:hypothetical protein
LKKRTLVGTFLITALLLSGCAETEEEPITEEMKKINEKTDILTTPIVEENFQAVEQQVNLNELTAAEKKTYETFQKTKSDATLQNLDAITLAKFYIQAKKTQDYATLYALYFNPKQAAASEEQYVAEEKQKATENAQFVAPFATIQKVNVLTSGEKNQYFNIQYQLPDQTQYSFHLQKNKQGVWKFQFPAVSAK